MEIDNVISRVFELPLKSLGRKGNFEYRVKGGLPEEVLSRLGIKATKVNGGNDIVIISGKGDTSTLTGRAFRAKAFEEFCKLEGIEYHKMPKLSLDVIKKYFRQFVKR